MYLARKAVNGFLAAYTIALYFAGKLCFRVAVTAMEHMALVGNPNVQPKEVTSAFLR